MTGMHIHPMVYEAIESPIGYVRRTDRGRRVINLDLTNAERVFLRFGLRDISRAIEKIYHVPAEDRIISNWNRKMVRERVVRVRQELDAGRLALLVISPCDKQVIRHAIENNDYFVIMADDDYRLTPAQVRAAEALRNRAVVLLDMPIRPVPLGQGRDRIAEPLS